MYIVAQKKTFIAPVVAHIPSDNGRTQKISFSVVFKALSKPEVDDLLESIRKRAQENEAAIKEGRGRAVNSDRALIDEVLVGFGDDLRDEDNTPMAYTPANVDRLCSVWPIEPAIARSFIEHYISAPTKN